MAEARGETLIELHVYTALLLSLLNVHKEESRQMRKIYTLSSACDPEQREFIFGRCSRAARMMIGTYGSFDNAGAKVLDSNRGRNYFDCIISDKWDVPTLLEVVVTDNKTGTPSSEHRIRYERLMDLLLEQDIPYEARVPLEQRYVSIRDMIDKYPDALWGDLPDKSADVFMPARDVLKDTALCLHKNGSGLMPVLWGLYYDNPVLRVTFARDRIFLQYIDPVHDFDPAHAVLENTPVGTGLYEQSGGRSVRIRIHNSSTRMSPQSLVAGISFDFPRGLNGRKSG